jgi:hypothetical protein
LRLFFLHFFKEHHTDFEIFSFAFFFAGITEFGGLAWSDTLWGNRSLASLILSENPLGDEVCMYLCMYIYVCVYVCVGGGGVGGGGESLTRVTNPVRESPGR